MRRPAAPVSPDLGPPSNLYNILTNRTTCQLHSATDALHNNPAIYGAAILHRINPCVDRPETALEMLRTIDSKMNQAFATRGNFMKINALFQ